MLRVPKLDGVVEIAEFAPVPDLDRAAVAALLLPDAHPLWVIAVSAERRGAGGADPFAAALMPALLLGQPLPQGLHQFLPAAERLDLLFLRLGQKPLSEPFQPGLGEFGLGVRQGLDALEAMPEHPVEAVEMPLVFDQRGAREKIEFLDVEHGDAPFHRLHQGEVLAQRDRHFCLAQFGEKREEHGGTVRRRFGPAIRCGHSAGRGERRSAPRA